MRRVSRIADFELPAELRAALKPLVAGSLLRMEAALTPLIKDAFTNYMQDVVEITLATTELKRKSGKLDASLRQNIKVTGSSLRNIKGTYRGIYYAPLLEYGGIIEPTHESSGDYPAQLAIPLDHVKRPDGSLKLGGPKAWSSRYNTFTYVSKKTGQAYLAYKDKNSGRLILLFMFIPEARVTAKLGLRRAHAANLRILANTIGRIMVAAMASCDIEGFALGKTTTLAPKTALRSMAKNVLRPTVLRTRR